MNVRVPTAKVISMLETKLKELQKRLKDYDAAKVKYDADKAKWEKAIQKIPIPKERTIKVRTSYEYQNGGWRKEVYSNCDVNGTCNATVLIQVPLGSLPAIPVAPKEIECGTGLLIENIEQSLRVLRLTDQEHVNASTFKQISKYL